MENAADALKIAFALLMFVVAIGISMSSFSNVTEVASKIIKMEDRENEYTYVEPSSDLTRIVGVETVVPAMYRAYLQNIEIYFFDKYGQPLPLYYKTDHLGKKETDDVGNEIKINYINLMLERFGTADEAIDHLDTLLGTGIEDINVSYDGEYNEQIIYQNGLYAELSKYKFKESLGEYYQGTGSTKIKKRVITYTVVD